MMGKIFKKVAVVVGLAALAGYVAGLLTAPKSGKETREDLKNTAASGKTEAERQLRRVVAELGTMTDEARSRAANLNDTARKQLDGLVEQAKVARDKAREVVSAFHEGDAEDDDLRIAVADANRALAHLREYLKK